MLVKLSPIVERKDGSVKDSTDLWFGTSGPHDAEIVIVGEAWGAEEAAASRPFVGASGVELNRMLSEAGIHRHHVLCTNVAATRPLNNEMWRLFHAKDSVTPTYGGLQPNQTVLSDVQRLYQQLRHHPRRLVIATGNYALWALTNCSGRTVLRSSNNRPIPKELQPFVPTGIMDWRGSMWYMIDDRFATQPQYTKTKVLPIIHPAAILRQWENRAVTLHDLRARIPMALKNDWRQNPEPVMWAPPTFDQAASRLRMWIAKANQAPLRLATDIETRKKSFMTCVGFADSTNFAMSIPFVRKISAKVLDSYWSVEQETILVRLIQELLTHPNILIEGQNFIYDTQYFQHWMAITPKLDFDTMLAQNTLFPGTPKGLDYLSSLFCRYHWYWKEDGKDWDDITGTLEEHLTYNCWDCLRTFECATVQRDLIPRMEQTEQWKLKMRVNDLCLRMMNRGVLFDKSSAAAMRLKLMEAAQSLERELYAIVPQEAVQPGAKTPWFNSPQQTKWLFYEAYGFKVIKDRKTGQPTTGDEALNELKKHYPEFTGLFDRIGKLRSIGNTARVIQSKLDSDGRLRCSFNPGGTETHRLSSSLNAFGGGMNLQNLTKGEED